VRCERDPYIFYRYAEQCVGVNLRREDLSGIFYLSMSLGFGALFPSENFAIF